MAKKPLTIMDIPIKYRYLDIWVRLQDMNHRSRCKVHKTKSIGELESGMMTGWSGQCKCRLLRLQGMVDSSDPCRRRPQTHVKGLGRQKCIIVEVTDKTKGIFPFGYTQVAALVATSFDGPYQFGVMSLKQNIPSVLQFLGGERLMLMGTAFPERACV